MSAAALLAGSGSAMQGAAALIPAVFGNATEGSSKIKGTSTTSGTTVESLSIDQEGIDKIIQDVLGGAEGLASIFSGEQNAGIFDSSVAAQAAGDLASRLVGEIAQLTAEKTTKQDQTTKQKQSTKTAAKDGGLVGQVGSAFGF